MSMRIVLILLGLLGLAPAVLAENTVRCESPDFRYRQCPVDTRGGVRLVRRLSRALCVEGQTWGVERDGIWVDQGCAAEFAVGEMNSGDGYPGAGDGQLACKSENFRYNLCRADIRGRVELTRQLSNAPCRQDETWGVTRDGIWVDQGCSAEFRVMAGAVEPRPPWTGGARPPWAGGGNAGPDRLICESRDFRYRFCQADTRDGVRLLRQLSEAPCRQGETWGVNRDGVWVDRGCVAEFAVERAGEPGYDDEHRRTVVCRSRSLRREHCRADVSGGVSLLRQLSRRSCIQGQSWGVDRGGIWVDQGCDAEFVLERRGGFIPGVR